MALLKSTAVAFLIAVPDLMTKAKAIAVQTYDPIGAYLAAAVLYLVMVFLLDQFLKWVERTTRIPGLELEGKKPKRVAAQEFILYTNFTDNTVPHEEIIKKKQKMQKDNGGSVYSSGLPDP